VQVLLKIRYTKYIAGHYSAGLANHFEGAYQIICKFRR